MAQKDAEQRDKNGTAAALKVIDAFGGIRPMAQKLGVAASTVQGWKERQAIPENRHAAIRKVMAADSLPITEETLTASAHPPAGKERSTADSAPGAAPSTAPEAGTAPETTAAVAWGGASEEAERVFDAEESQRRTSAGEEQPRQFSLLAAFFLGALVLGVGALGTLAFRDLWMPPVSPSGEGDALAAIDARVAKLESAQDPGPRLSALEKDTAAALIEAQKARDEARRALAADSSAGSAADLKALDSRLSQALAEVAARLERVESHQVVRPVSTDDLILTLSLGRLREAILLGDPFDDLLEAAEKAASGRPAVARELTALEPFAKTGVPRLVALQQSFGEAARDIVAAGAGEGEEDSILAGIKRRIARVVTIRPLASEVEGDGSNARVARAENALARGDLASAIAQIEGLEGLAAEAGSAWLQDARRRLIAERRLAAATETFLAELSTATAGN